MRAQNNAGQRQVALQRVLALFCILILFVFVGIVFFLSPKAYAHNRIRSLTGAVAVRRTRTPVIIITPTDTPILPTPTDTPTLPTPTDTPIPVPTNTPIPVPTNTPIPVPTNTPIPVPTNTPIPVPTNTPIPVPTNTPIPINTPIPTHPPMPTATPMPTHSPIKPGTTPTTTVAAPISTSAAGVPPGGTLQPTPTPPQIPATKTPKSAGLPPGTTPVVPTATTITTAYSNNAITAQNNGKMLLPTVTEEIALGSSLAGAAALIGWYVWRRRQGGLLATTQYIPQTSVSYTQTAYADGNIGGVSENGPSYSPNIANQGMFPETQYAQDTIRPDDSLEAIMRQARVGLFALPNKEEYS